MKRKYKKPRIVGVRINTNVILAGSPNLNVDPSSKTDEMESKDNGNMFWVDDEE